MKPYTVSELKYIEENHHLSNIRLAIELDRTPIAIRDQIYMMRKTGKLKPTGRSKPRPFTESEISYICQHFRTKGCTAIARELNRSRNVIGNKYRQLRREGKVDKEAIG